MKILLGRGRGSIVHIGFKIFSFIILFKRLCCSVCPRCIVFVNILFEAIFKFFVFLRANSLKSAIKCIPHYSVNLVISRWVFSTKWTIVWCLHLCLPFKSDILNILIIVIAHKSICSLNSKVIMLILAQRNRTMILGIP